jgi:hypothetical protein
MLMIVASVLTGCVSGDDDSQDPAEQTAEAASGSDQSAPLTGPPSVGAVVWSSAVQPETNEPVSPVESFPDTTSVLYAVFPIQRLPEGSTIRAFWTFNGTSLDGLDQEITSPRDQVSGWLEFHLERTGQEPWPDGTYAITLTSDSVQIATGEVVVVKT